MRGALLAAAAALDIATSWVCCCSFCRLDSDASATLALGSPVFASASRLLALSGPELIEVTVLAADKAEAGRFEGIMSSACSSPEGTEERACGAGRKTLPALLECC